MSGSAVQVVEAGGAPMSALRYIRIYSDSIARHDMGDALDIEERCNQKACFSNSLLDKPERFGGLGANAGGKNKPS